MHVFGRSNRLVVASVAIAGAALLGCHEEQSTAPHMVPTPGGMMHDLGTVIVHVDLKHGTVTTSPASSTQKLPPGVSARFFGTTAQIHYALTDANNSALGGSDFEYSLHANFTNLLGFAIGTNSPHEYPDEPQDTMGVYVYYAIPIYNIQANGGPCAPPACTVTIDSADGVFPFTTAEPQPYVYWKTILEGGAPGPVSTNQSGFETSINFFGIDYFRRLSFRTHGNVTDFSFGIAMAAPWVEPNEARWKVFYTADSLPDRVDLQHLRSEPDWRVLGTEGGISTIELPGCVAGTNTCALQIVSTTALIQPETLLYYRSDSLRAAQDGYIAATMTATPAPLSEAPSIFLGMKDPDKLVQLGISGMETGFTDSTGAFVPTFTVPTDAERSSWRVSKFGVDSAAIYSPANSVTPLLVIPYESLPAAPPHGLGDFDYDHFFFFGNVTQPLLATDATSVWSNVSYEIGAAGP